MSASEIVESEKKPVKLGGPNRYVKVGITNPAASMAIPLLEFFSTDGGEWSDRGKGCFQQFIDMELPEKRHKWFYFGIS